MAIEINHSEFLDFCKTATSMEVVEKVTEGNVRGLDTVAIRKLSMRRQLPCEIENILLAYFFREFANKVYDRNSLSKLYDHWVTRRVVTVSQAEKMVKEDIHSVLEELNTKNYH